MPDRTILCIGNLAAGKTEISSRLGSVLRQRLVAIDECRRELGDGTAAGEARAWSSFLSQIQMGEPMVAECSGGGPFTHLVRHALGAMPYTVVFVRTPRDVCLDRIRVRGLNVPYPDFGVAIEKVVDAVERDLDKQVVTTWNGPRIDVDGTGPVEVAVERVLSFLRCSVEAT